MKTPILFIAIYLALAGLLAARVPLGKAPDESAHIYYVEHLATTHSFPVFKPLKPSENPGYEFHQPPLYYAICATAWNALGPGVQNYWCRVVSLLFGAATVGLVWGAAWRLFDKSVAALAAGFAALWPLHLNVGAFAGNDAAAGFFCALLLYLVARGAKQEPPSIKSCVVLGATCGLAMLTKSSCLTVAFAAIGWAIHASIAASGERRLALRNGALVAGAAALICGPWLARNSALYGDPLALRVFDQAFRGSSPGPADFLQGGVAPGTYLRSLFAILFCTAWGAFGGPNTALQLLNPLFGGPSGRNLPLIQPTALLLVPCAAASVVALLGLTRSWPLASAARAERPALLWWMLAAAAVLLAWTNFNVTYFQAQARYLHPALLPAAVLAAYGWRTVLGPTRGYKFMTAAFACVLLALTWLNAFGWRTLV